MNRVHVVLAGCVLIASTAAAQQHPMRPGQWEMTMQMQIPNMPQQMPAMKAVQCITQAQIDGPEKGVPTGPQKNPNDCKVTDYKLAGNVASWKMTCVGPPAMSGTGEIKFEGDSYDGTMKMLMEQGEMNMKLSAKRLGECK